MQFLNFFQKGSHSERICQKRPSVAKHIFLRWQNKEADSMFKASSKIYEGLMHIKNE